MGILQDYFRAPDASAAIELAVGPGGDIDQHSGTLLDDHGIDWFDAKGIDPYIALGQLIAFVKGIPFAARATAPALVWPDERLWPQGEVRPGQTSPWEGGLFLQQLPDEWIATLAGIQDEHLPLLARRWRDIPEANFTDVHAVQATIVEFRALARRARDHGHGVYCRTVV
ncbi:hypothetical protein [Streptomyces sp. NPDC057052]|uniref:hypothetical protein n=1 Tax=Streptomyces sp. NPDC057052 TaxID=3346010 RepID=UPI003631D452